jgi:hypothetical protein
MKQEEAILTLSNYLEEVQFPAGLPQGTTFARTFPATEKLPEITIGLGLLRASGSMTIVELTPPIKHARIITVNTFINEVAEQYLKCSGTAPDQWQELLLLELGYIRKLNWNRFNAMQNFVLFSAIPEKERLFLLNKHGIHKLATIAAYGRTDNIDEIITTLDELNEELPEEANYGTIMQLLAVGVPVEDLHLAVQLPEDMVAEIYGESNPEN